MEVSFESGNLIVLDSVIDTLRGVNVQRVNVATSGLAALPARLACMESVTHLDLSWNPIKTGWEQLSSLKCLRELILFGCQITELPAALVGMESMTSLDLGGNSINSGWEHLRLLRQLRLLVLHGCNLR